MVPVYAKAREVTWMGQPKLAEGRCVGLGSGLGFRCRYEIETAGWNSA